MTTAVRALPTSTSADTIFRVFGPVFAFLWGIGQHLPQRQIYVAGVGPGDVIFLLYCACAVAIRGDRWVALDELRRHPAYVATVLAFVALGLASGTVNAVRDGMQAKDLVELLRPLYYVLIAMVTAAWVRRYGRSGFVAAFMAGVVTVVLANFFYDAPERLTVLGFRTLRNPNVMANMISVGVLFASFLILRHAYLLAVALAAMLVPMSVFTYSKGGWLTVAVALVACGLAFVGGTAPRPRGRFGSSRGWVYAALTALAIAIVALLPALVALVRFKLATSHLGASAAEGGTVAARWSFVAASGRMVMEHPLLGIGISNYEREYDRLRDFLGANYHATDNPHSAFLYVLACMGIPAFAVVTMLFMYPFRFLRRTLDIQPALGRAYVACAFVIFFVSGLTALELWSQPFFWVFTGLVFGGIHAHSAEAGWDERAALR